MKKFLCSFCGIFIKKNRANLDRHENLHQPLIRKIKCAEKNCVITFQTKSSYAKHWNDQHPNKKMPDGLEFVNEKPKLKKIKRNIHTVKKVITSNVASKNDFKLKSIITNCIMREPLFGKLLWNGDI